MYRLERVFCATSWELEHERRAFYDVAGAVNEAEGMPRGVLFTPVSLTNIRDKRPLQCAIEENISDATHYILALDGGWGPAERNFERDYHLAVRCRLDPALPMRNVELLLRTAQAGATPPFAAELAAAGIPYRLFQDTADFRQQVAAFLQEWLPAASLAAAV